MSVADHPKYEKWSEALDHLKEANDQYRDAVKAGSGVDAAKLDLDKAQEKYDKICNELD